MCTFRNILARFVALLLIAGIYLASFGVPVIGSDPPPADSGMVHLEDQQLSGLWNRCDSNRLAPQSQETEIAFFSTSAK